MYDNFDDVTWDGAWNPAKWRFEGNNAFQARQQGGVLVFTQTPAPAGAGASLLAIRPEKRNLQQLRWFEGRLKLADDHSGGFASVQLFIANYDVPKGSWWTQCKIAASSDRKPYFGCDVTSGNQHEHSTPSVSLNYNTWYRVRIEMSPDTCKLDFYLNDGLVESYTPLDATALIVSSGFRPSLGVWNGHDNTLATRYVDDVRITPAR